MQGQSLSTEPPHVSERIWVSWQSQRRPAIENAAPLTSSSLTRVGSAWPVLVSRPADRLRASRPTPRRIRKRGSRHGTQQGAPLHVTGRPGGVEPYDRPTRESARQARRLVPRRGAWREGAYPIRSCRALESVTSTAEILLPPWPQAQPLPRPLPRSLLTVANLSARRPFIPITGIYLKPESTGSPEIDCSAMSADRWSPSIAPS